MKSLTLVMQMYEKDECMNMYERMKETAVIKYIVLQHLLQWSK